MDAEAEGVAALAEAIVPDGDAVIPEVAVPDGEALLCWGDEFGDPPQLARTSTIMETPTGFTSRRTLQAACRLQCRGCNWPSHRLRGTLASKAGPNYLDTGPVL
jgi:hypothetical protein